MKFEISKEKLLKLIEEQNVIINFNSPHTHEWNLAKCQVSIYEGILECLIETK